MESEILKNDKVVNTSFREVGHPIICEQLPLAASCSRIQFTSEMAADDYQKLADFMALYPEIVLRAYSVFHRDLAFLQYFPRLKRFWCDLHTLNDCHGLSYLESLTHLRFQVTFLSDWTGLARIPETLESLDLDVYQKKFPLTFLDRFRALTHLSIANLTRDLRKKIGSLTLLRSLGLYSVHLSDLTPLTSLENLEELRLGCTSTLDLSLLPKVGKLRKLGIISQRKLEDLSCLESLHHLEDLNLENLPMLTQLPSLKDLKNLRSITFERLQQIGADKLHVLLEAPYLEELTLLQMRHIPIQQLAFLKNHPRLKQVTFGLENSGLYRTYPDRRLNDLLGLPPVGG